MRVALVSEHASPLAAVGGVDAGGQNVHVAALACALGRLGHEVVVHTRRDDAGLPRRVPLGPGVEVDHVAAGPPRPIPKDELLPHMGAFAAELAACWAVERPDVAHAHFWMSGLATARAAVPLGIPMAMTFHALGVVKRRHQGAADTSPASRLGIERHLVAVADRVVATCSDEVAELAALGADLGRVRVVPCGVDLGRFSAAVAPEPRLRRRARLVAVGRLVPRKGLDDVITALAAVPRAELVVAGGPPVRELDACPEARRLRQVALAAGVGDRVVLRGQVDRAAMPALLRSADVVVCAPWYEPFGIVPLEAMACGVPVVGTAVGGLTDTVVDGVTGLLVPPRRPAALGAALAALLADPARRRAMGRAGQIRARARYGWETVAQRTLAAYAEVVAAPAGVAL